MQEQRKCLICGIYFNTIGHNAKYCPECKLDASRMTRKAWEERTNYNDKQRDKARERREQERKDQEKRRTAVVLKARQEIEMELSNRREKARKELEKKAASGDLFSKMQLAVPNSVEYWEYFKLHELQEYEKNMTIPCKRVVNGISIHEEDFAIKVVESIKETGRICSVS